MVFNNINNQFFFVFLAARLRSNQKSEFLATEMRILQNETGDDGRTNKTGMDLEHQKTWRYNDITLTITTVTYKFYITTV